MCFAGLPHYILFLLAALLTALVIAPFFYGRYDLPYVAIQFTGGLLELLLIFLLFKIKRLRRGMPFLYQIGSSATGFILSCFILLIVTIISFYDSIPDMQFLFLLIALFLIGLLLYCWWRFRITRDYHRRPAGWPALCARAAAGGAAGAGVCAHGRRLG